MQAQQSASRSAGRIREIDKEGAVFFNKSSRRFVTSLLLFGLMTEWLLPLEQLKAYTELYRVGPVIAAVGCFLAVGLLVPPVWASLLLNGVVCVGAVLYMFSVQSPSAVDSMARLIQALSGDALRVMEGHLQLSGETRTLLLIMGLGMMAAAVQSLVWLRQWGLGLTALTALYLLALYAFLGIDVLPGLIRACTEGLLLSALLTLPRIERLLGAVHSVRSRNGSVGGWPVSWWSGAALAAVLLTAAGVIAQWGTLPAAGPAPWVTEAVDWGKTHLTKSRTAAVSRNDSINALNSGAVPGTAGLTGYGFDDSRLGAPISPDSTALFTVLSPESTYMRGESKAFYNGQGWDQPNQRMEEKTIAENKGTAGMEASNSPGAGGATAEPDVGAAGETGRVIRQTVTAEYPSPGWPLLTAGADAQVVALNPVVDDRKAAYRYRLNTATGALYPADGELVKQYTIETRMPDMSADTLRTVDGSVSDPADIAEEYTQLPLSLPARVGGLAKEIADGTGGGRYETVKAIEAYLRSHFAYTQKGTSVPVMGEDFVDQFLFEQKQGYCVHFATAMTVMLRTQGIPARYVKGFAPGEAGDGGALEGTPSTGGANAKAYTLRASDAHAWVEVFFPGVGWVPFEPTPGFAAPAGEAGGAGAAASAADSADAAQHGLAAAAGNAAAPVGAGRAAERAMRAAAQLQAAAVRAAEAAMREANALAQAARGAAAARPWAVAALAACATAAAVLSAAAWRKRERFAFASALRRYGSALDTGRLTAARGQFLALADACWRELYRRCGARPAHSTAREYAAALALPPQTAQLVADFVRWDEQARYDADWLEMPTKEQVGAFLSALSHQTEPRRISIGKQL
ncbi:transglutaminase-like domain-containing protein [Paenibacillus sp. sptzw28]|uniref:transglutaminase-like domain-containing protein n=1 Tax=Paenibacillus sp. sptzw28 TaxID=715179 RepID=UPI0028694EA7|nr:transglutaminase-like domain-containing protein [Paenibacillus sp. sptzw28]